MRGGKWVVILATLSNKFVQIRLKRLSISGIFNNLKFVYIIHE